jgi:hypothetical protein
VDINEAGTDEKVRQSQALGTLLESIFKDDDGALKTAHHQFDASHTFAQILEKHLTKWLLRKLPDARPQPTWTKGSPFRGLSVFEAEHAPIFKGRGRAIAELLQKAREHAAAGKAFTLVLGQSGSGKSSLLRAGVLPLLTQPGVIEGVGLWRHAIFAPDQNQGRLFELLSAALLQALPELGADGTAPTELVAMLSNNPEGARPLIKGGLSQAAFALQQEKKLERQPTARLVLLVDQFETLFTAEGIDAPARVKFIGALSALAQSGLVWVFATIRSDFYHRLEEVPGLLDLKAGAEYQLAAPGASELAEIIRLPAQAAGLAFEKDSTTGRGLDDELIDAAAHNLQNLPLLEFVLDELYRADQMLESEIADSQAERQTQVRPVNQRGLLEFQEYKAIGGMEGAIANRAEAVLCEATLTEAAAFAAVMRRLVSQRPGDPANRRLAPKAEFTGHAAALAERLTQARLMIAGPDGLALAHDALLTRWRKLAEQISADADFHVVRTRIAESEDRWRRDDCPTDLLLRPGRELEESRDILTRYGADLSQSERAYVEASISHHARERKRHERLRQKVMGVLTLMLMVALVAAGWALVKQKESKRNASLAQK